MAQAAIAAFVTEGTSPSETLAEWYPARPESGPYPCFSVTPGAGVAGTKYGTDNAVAKT